jgi:hypothetical protein
LTPYKKKKLSIFPLLHTWKVIIFIYLDYLSRGYEQMTCVILLALHYYASSIHGWNWDFWMEGRKMIDKVMERYFFYYWNETLYFLLLKLFNNYSINHFLEIRTGGGRPMLVRHLSPSLVPSARRQSSYTTLQ